MRDKVKVYQQTKFRQDVSIGGWDKTTSDFEIQTSTTLEFYFRFRSRPVRPLTDSLEPHSNGPLYMKHYGDWYTGRWRVGCYIWYSEEGTGRGPSPPRPLLAVPNVRAYPSTASVPTTYCLMWQHNCLYTLKGQRNPSPQTYHNSRHNYRCHVYLHVTIYIIISSILIYFFIILFITA